jgi:cytochrome c
MSTQTFKITLSPVYCKKGQPPSEPLLMMVQNPQRKTMKTRLFALMSVAAALTSLQTPAFADAALAQAKNCMACHAVDKKMVGPSYKDVAAKYAGNKDAAAMLAEKIQKGSTPGKGNWGAIPMPANPQVNAAEAAKLAAWVLTVK